MFKWYRIMKKERDPSLGIKGKLIVRVRGIAREDIEKQISEYNKILIELKSFHPLTFDKVDAENIERFKEALIIFMPEALRAKIRGNENCCESRASGNCKLQFSA